MEGRYQKRSGCVRQSQRPPDARAPLSKLRIEKHRNLTALTVKTAASAL
jgi:hypothetical protein